MRCPSLSELPPPPDGRKGWPWLEESPKLPEVMPDGRPWPRVSIVTPSYNQAHFVEETIRSVLLQGYPELEYFVIDGGSTDGAVEVIRRYEKWFGYWVSEPDRGQSHAINKGFERATGELFAWINSDDYYLPGALATVGGGYSAAPRPSVLIGSGTVVRPDGSGRMPIEPEHSDFDSIMKGHRTSMGGYPTFMQQSAFFPASDYRAVGGLDEELHFAMDLDLWLKLARRIPFVPVERELAVQVLHPSCKGASQAGKMFAEICLVKIKHGGKDIALSSIAELHDKFVTLAAKVAPFVNNPLYRLARPVLGRLMGWKGQ